jgi:hypothetical protein
MKDDLFKEDFFKSNELQENGMLKSISHKYIKRTGVAGNYKYWYKDASGKLVEGKKPNEKENRIDIVVKKINDIEKDIKEDLQSMNYSAEKREELYAAELEDSEEYQKLLNEYSKFLSEKLKDSKQPEKLTEAQKNQIVQVRKIMKDLKTGLKNIDKKYESKQPENKEKLSLSYNGGKWNHNDTDSNGVISSYTKDGNKIKIFMRDDKWKYSGFIDRKSVSGNIPNEYVSGFDDGNQKIMNKFVGDLYSKK